MTLYIKTDERDFYENHSTYHEGDAGIDLFFVRDQTFKKNSQGNKIQFNIQCSLMKKASLLRSFMQPSGYLLVPRSSISKTPLRMSNSIGIIDSSYRGEIMAMVDNISNEDFSVKKGERLFQIVDPTLEPFFIKLVNRLNETSRGEQGFGSTN